MKIVGIAFTASGKNIEQRMDCLTEAGKSLYIAPPQQLESQWQVHNAEDKNLTPDDVGFLRERFWFVLTRLWQGDDLLSQVGFLSRFLTEKGANNDDKCFAETYYEAAREFLAIYFLASEASEIASGIDVTHYTLPYCIESFLKNVY